MAFLQSSGQISLNQIRNIFGGGTGQIGLKAFYRAGGRVPNDAFCHNNTIPSSGQISVRNFWNTSNGADYVGFSSDNSSNQTARFHTIQPNVTRVQIWAAGGGGGGVYMYASQNCLGSTPVSYARAGQAISTGSGGGGSFFQIGVQPGGTVQINVGKAGAGFLLTSALNSFGFNVGFPTAVYYNGSLLGDAQGGSGGSVSISGLCQIGAFSFAGSRPGGVGNAANGGANLTEHVTGPTTNSVLVTGRAGGAGGYAWLGGSGGRAGPFIGATPIRAFGSASNRVADAGVNGGATLRY